MNCYKIKNESNLEVEVLDRGCIIKDITFRGRSIVAKHEKLVKSMPGKPLFIFGDYCFF